MSGTRKIFECAFARLASRSHLIVNLLLSGTVEEDIKNLHVYIPFQKLVFLTL